MSKYRSLKINNIESTGLIILRGNTEGSKAWMSPLACFDEVRAVFEGGASREEEDTTGISPGSFIDYWNLDILNFGEIE